MSLTTTIDISRFNRAMGDYYDALLSPKEAAGFVKDQSSRLVQTLIKITPPVDRKKTMDRIAANVDKRVLNFQSTKHDFNGIPAGWKYGRKDVRWYAWSKDALYGVMSKELDATGLSTQGLYELLYLRMTSGGRFVVGRRGKQTIKIWRKVLAKKRTVARLKALLKKNVGKLKAGWLASWRKLGSETGIYNPPKWITDHANNARGFCVDGLGIPNFPTFSIANQGAGITHEGCIRILNNGLEIRAKAMMKDMKLKLKHAKLKAGLN